MGLFYLGAGTSPPRVPGPRSLAQSPIAASSSPSASTPLPWAIGAPGPRRPAQTRVLDARPESRGHTPPHPHPIPPRAADSPRRHVPQSRVGSVFPGPGLQLHPNLCTPARSHSLSAGSLCIRHPSRPPGHPLIPTVDAPTLPPQKKSLNDPDNHNGVITLLEPDIPGCEVKWALGSITRNKASRGDGIPAKLFQILKDDAVKVLYSICQQIWKTQQWPQDWKRCFHSNHKEGQCHRMFKLLYN